MPKPLYQQEFRGFSLIELLVAIAITGGLSLAAFSLMSANRRLASEMDRRSLADGEMHDFARFFKRAVDFRRSQFPFIDVTGDDPTFVNPASPVCMNDVQTNPCVQLRVYHTLTNGADRTITFRSQCRGPMMFRFDPADGFRLHPRDIACGVNQVPWIRADVVGGSQSIESRTWPRTLENFIAASSCFKLVTTCPVVPGAGQGIAAVAELALVYADGAGKPALLSGSFSIPITESAGSVMELRPAF